MKKKELNYEKLADKLLEGMCIATQELLEHRIKYGDFTIDIPKGFEPLTETLKHAWIVKYISEKTGISEDELEELAWRGE